PSGWFQASTIRRLRCELSAPSRASYRGFDDSVRFAAMQFRILGTTLPVLELVIDPGETIVSEAGELSWMTSTISLRTSTQLAGGGGAVGALKRVGGGGTPF